MVIAAPTTPGAAAALWSAPAVPYMVIDIETADADEVAVLAEEQRLAEKKGTRSTTIAKVRERAALLDAAPVICVALKAESGGLLFTWMPTELKEASGFPIFVARDEAGMLSALGEFLGRMTWPETVLVAHNAEFDTKKLRLAYLRHRLPLPGFLLPRAREDRDSVFCTMRRFSYDFSLDRSDGFIKLEEACERAGIADVVDGIEGSLVPEFYRRKQYREVLEHCAWDVRLTEQLFHRMVGYALVNGGPAVVAEASTEEQEAQPEPTAPSRPPPAPAAAAPATSAPSASKPLSDTYYEFISAIDGATHHEQLSEISRGILNRRKELWNGEFAELWERWKRKADSLLAAASK